MSSFETGGATELHAADLSPTSPVTGLSRSFIGGVATWSCGWEQPFPPDHSQVNQQGLVSALEGPVADGMLPGVDGYGNLVLGDRLLWQV